MFQSNITPITKSKLSSTETIITLDSVRAAITAWRKTKKTSSEKMPTVLWSQVLRLLEIETQPDSRTLAALNLTRTQLEAEKRRRQLKMNLDGPNSRSVESIDFCKVEQDTGAAVIPFPDTKPELNISEEDWFAKEILEDKLHKAANNQQPKMPLIYKPAEAFSTATSVVEIRRPDGMLMSIHICTDRFEELLRAFFKG